MTDDRLRLIVERIERLIEERKDISDDIRDVYAEAKAIGYDAATIRKLIARRGMKPDDRAESDALLETYEAALGGLIESEDVPLRPDAAAAAVAMLAAEIVVLEDPAVAAMLVGHVIALLDLRAEIAVLRAEEGMRKKLAKGEGFDAKQLAVVVRWYEKCAKHGPDAMKAGEATFGLYRATVDEAGGPVAQADAVIGDSKLAALFSKPAEKAPTRAAQAVSGAIAMAAASRMNREVGG